MTDERKKELMTRKNNPLDTAGVVRLTRLYHDFLDYHDQVSFEKPIEKLKAKDMLPFIWKYLQGVDEVFNAFSKGDPKKGYLIGAYGSGLTLSFLKKNMASVVTYFWLSQSKGWPGYEEFLKAYKPDLQQQGITHCDWPHPVERGKKVDFDFDLVGNIKPGKPDTWRWRGEPKAQSTGAH